MKAGRLMHVVTLERASHAVNEYGTPAATWGPLATLRAEVVERSTEEFLAGAGATDEASIVFRTRSVEGVRTGDRVSFQGEAFPIREVVRIGRRQGLELRCVRREADE